MKIGIDLDDTVWKFHEKFFEFYNEKYGTNYKYEEYKIYDIGKYFNIERKDALILVDEYESLKKYEILPLIDNVEKSLIDLSKNHEIYFITARSTKTKDIVLKRLEKIFSHKNHNVIFMHNENWEKINEKVDFCLSEGIDVIIDDNFDNLRLCSEEGIKGILITCPWNANEELDKKIIRVNSWNEIMEVLNEKIF